MKLRVLFFSALLCVCFAFQSIGYALSEAVQALVDFETKANAASERSNEAIMVEHFEIPLELVEKELSARLDPKIYEAFIFTKEGKQFVRWVINPEDSKWHKEVEKFLKKNNLPTTRHQYFKGYQTASRSYILEDPTSQVQFSLKTSTDKTGGMWRDKKQEWLDSTHIRLAADYVSEMQQRKPFQNLIFLDEPGAFGIRQLDQGMVIRTLGELTHAQSGKIYLPGFSAVHEQIGREIALKNGSNDPEKFWNENYNIPLARALAEFLARTGMYFDSPHSQNFLIELDSQYRPTGKIILRDLGDMYLNREFFKAANRYDILKTWDAENIISKDPVIVGILHGNEAPKWISEAQYKKWGQDFNKVFTQTYAVMTGISQSKISGPIYQSGMYFSRDISNEGSEYENFYQMIQKHFRQLPSFSCRQLLLAD